MCKNAGLLLGWDFQQKRVLVTRGDCKQWDCHECAVKHRERWVLRAQMGVRQYLGEGLKVDFVTITSHERLKTFTATDYVWRQAWPKLYAALKRHAEKLEYFIVPERHKDGRMHVHALWTANVSQKWVKDNGRRRGLGYQAKVKHVADAQAASNYVTKYVGKSLGEDCPENFRRVRVSQGWPDIPLPITDMSGLKWEYVTSQMSLEASMSWCDAHDIDMIDAKDSGFWDYEPVYS